MNDRYLFKAKRIDNGEWAIGNLVYSEDADEEFKVIIIPTKDSCMYTDRKEEDLGFEDWYKVDASTICQCTNLKDKAGNLIWENDLVLTPKEDGYSLICWNDTEARWEMRNETEGIVLDFDNYWSNEIEVCENIFDNPELMEVE